MLNSLKPIISDPQFRIERAIIGISILSTLIQLFDPTFPDCVFSIIRCFIIPFIVTRIALPKLVDKSYVTVGFLGVLTNLIPETLSLVITLYLYYILDYRSVVAQARGHPVPPMSAELISITLYGLFSIWLVLLGIGFVGGILATFWYRTTLPAHRN